MVASWHLPPFTFLSLSRTKPTCGATYYEANKSCLYVGAASGVVDVLPGDPEVDVAATPEANMPGQPPTTTMPSDPTTFVPAVLTMMMLFSYS